MTPVGGIVVTVPLFAVAMTTVFGADNVCFLECRTERGRAQTVVSEKEEKEAWWYDNNERARDRGRDTVSGWGRGRGGGLNEGQ